MEKNYKKIIILLILLDALTFALMGFLFKTYWFFIVAFLIKTWVNLSISSKKKLKPVLIFDGILALLPILAMLLPFLMQLFIQSDNLMVAGWVIVIIGIFASPMSIIYGGLLLAFGILSLRNKYKNAVTEQEE